MKSMKSIQAENCRQILIMDSLSNIQALGNELNQGLLNRWTSQHDLGCTTVGLERVISVHNST